MNTSHSYADTIACYVERKRKELGLSRQELTDAVGLPGGVYTAKLIERAEGHVVDLPACTEAVVAALGGRISIHIEDGPAKIDMRRIKQGARGALKIDMDREHFRRRMIELRAATGLSLRDLAQKMTISYNALHLYESGKSRPSSRVLKRIASYFDVTVASLCWPDA